MFSQVSNDIKVTVIPRYLESESSPPDDYFAWAYTVKIENNREQPIQLLNRHWRVYDANGSIQEVFGTGVIGQQPVIEPNAAFEYTSCTQLTTGFGIMVGDYEMIDSNDNQTIDVQIPPFSLDSPFNNLAH
ncbi:MAG: Co2+/Mg2+ efflux protein ApaG [Alphaproteobacteria bacterium]|nr:Co2+/Mg2+ efflux protein ApaG [Alphaproteobacteria bacterium]